MLVNLKEILTKYKANDAAIGCFNTPNSETVRAVIDAAEQLNVPVILAHAQLHDSIAPLDFTGGMMIDAAKRAKVPVCVHLDHGEDFLYVQRAIDMGFSSVMIDASAKSYEENKEITKKVTDYAHARGVSVEAELGKLMRNEAGQENGATESDYTDPITIEEFVSFTNVDVLAIAFGTAHGIYDKPPVLNVNVINACKAKTDCPLVMHGGSGISAEQYRDVIARGISKINYYTYMAYEGYAAAKLLVSQKEKGFYHDVAQQAYQAMKQNVLKTMQVFYNK